MYCFYAGLFALVPLLQILMKNLLLRLFFNGLPPYEGLSLLMLDPEREPFLRLPRMKDSASSLKSYREEEVMISSAIILPELSTPL